MPFKIFFSRLCPPPKQEESKTTANPEDGGGVQKCPDVVPTAPAASTAPAATAATKTAAAETAAAATAEAAATAATANNNDEGIEESNAPTTGEKVTKHHFSPIKLLSFNFANFVLKILELRERQKQMEEENKRRKALLAKEIEDRRGDSSIIKGNRMLNDMFFLKKKIRRRRTSQESELLRRAQVELRQVQKTKIPISRIMKKLNYFDCADRGPCDCRRVRAARQDRQGGMGLQRGKVNDLLYGCFFHVGISLSTMSYHRLNEKVT